MIKLLTCLVLSAVLGGCASQPEAPILNNLTGDALDITTTRLAALLPADVLLLGEQHDAKAHQQIHGQVIALLAQRGLLAAVVLEMADTGATTAGLHPSSTEQQTQSALKWDEKSWPWQAYGHAVMTAVRADVLVLGGNLPRTQMKPSTQNGALDGKLSGPALKAQQQLIRIGHCNLLPESQITPMTRIQIARDISMAAALVKAALPGKVVLLLSGSGHADRLLGVPQHLPATFDVKSVRMRSGAAMAADRAEAFDALWQTPPLPEKDYCAEFKAQMGN